MAIRKILNYTEPILRKKTKKVEEFDSELHELLDDMAETLAKANGAGLAAPQVGVLKAVCIIDVGDIFYEFINPQITEHSTSTNVHDEGCLSVLGKNGKSVFYPVERFNKVTVEAYNRHGEKFKVKLKGFPARAAQHEIDHLNGIIFLDHVTDFTVKK